MRTEYARSVVDAGSSAEDELLTTGEAARILNSSRQHIVDLCNRGDLPFVTVGTHRRVRRADVEQVRDRALRLTRDQRRSLWLAFAIAGRIVGDPDHARTLAYENLESMRRTSRGQARVWLDEWERLLAGPIEDLLAALTSRSQRGRDLRQNSPFAGVISDTERGDVLASWREYEDGKRRR